MTKAGITVEIAKRTGLPQVDVRRVVQLTLDSIIGNLVKERRVELRNFGIFVAKKRQARIARNPRTGEVVNVPAKYVVTFKPGKLMKERIS